MCQYSWVVVLLIVCVGINTGSAQGELFTSELAHLHTIIIIIQISSTIWLFLHTEYCQDGPSADRTCNYTNFDSANTDCMNTELDCVNNCCKVLFNGINHICRFNTYNGVNVTAEPIQCCFCEYTIGNTTHLWWDCDDTISSVLPSNGEQILCIH